MKTAKKHISESTVSELKCNQDIYPGKDCNLAPFCRKKPPFFHRGESGLIEYLVAGRPFYLDLPHPTIRKDLHLQQDLAMVSFLPRLQGIHRFWIVKISGSGRVRSTKTFQTKNIPACPCVVSCSSSIPLASSSRPFLYGGISNACHRLVPCTELHS